MDSWPDARSTDRGDQLVGWIEPVRSINSLRCCWNARSASSVGPMPGGRASAARRTGRAADAPRPTPAPRTTLAIPAAGRQCVDAVGIRGKVKLVETTHGGQAHHSPCRSPKTGPRHRASASSRTSIARSGAGSSPHRPARRSACVDARRRDVELVAGGASSSPNLRRVRCGDVTRRRSPFAWRSRAPDHRATAPRAVGRRSASFPGR